LRRFEKYAGLVDLPLSSYYMSRTAMPGTGFNRMKETLYKKEFAEALGEHKSGTPTQRLFDQVDGISPLNQMLYVDTKTWLPDDLLVKADKITMAASVELRVPLLDFQVLEFAAALPQDYKVSGWRLKRILKAALAESVPQEILNRKKTGFPVPYDKWLRNEMDEFVSDTILSQKASIYAYFSKNKVLELAQMHRDGKSGSEEIFCLLMLELLHFKFIAGTARLSDSTYQKQI
jgi:asparagine synthase (glutamine-hydrolysing)